MGRLDLLHIFKKKHVKFYKNLIANSSATMLAVYNSFCKHHYCTDSCLSLAQLPMSRMVNFIRDDCSSRGAP